MGSLSRGKKVIVWVCVVIMIFCASYLLTMQFVIKPAYTYLDENKVIETIEDLNAQIAQKDKMIVELQDELEIYKQMLEE